MFGLKKGSAFALFMLLCFVVFSIPQIAVVMADGTIYIKEDSKVTGTDKIQRDGSFYSFIGDIEIPRLIMVSLLRKVTS